MNKRKRYYMVFHLDHPSFLREGVAVPTLFEAISLYIKWTKKYPNSLLSIQEIFVIDTKFDV